MLSTRVEGLSRWVGAPLLSAVLLVALVLPARAERLVLTNGLEVKGYLVGLEKGHYLIQIGAYTKRVPEKQVKAIVEDDAPAPAASGPSFGQSAGPGIDAGALNQLLSGLGGGGGSGGQAANLQGLLSSLGGGGGPSGAGGADLQKLMGGLLGSGGGAPGAGGPDLQKLLGGLSGGGGAAGPLGGGNLMQMAERMRDPAFQQQFMNHLETMNKTGPNPGAATPYIQMLKGLFQQLNQSAGGASPPAGAARGK